MAIPNILLILMGEPKVQLRTEEHHNELQYDNDGILHDIFCPKATISSTKEVVS